MNFIDEIPPGEQVKGGKTRVNGTFLGIPLGGLALFILLIIVIAWCKGIPGSRFRTGQGNFYLLLKRLNTMLLTDWYSCKNFSDFTERQIWI